MKVHSLNKKITLEHQQERNEFILQDVNKK